MTINTPTIRGQSTVTAVDQDRARGVVHRHALDDADAAQLLAMLGLGDDQPEVTPPRGSGGHTSRRPKERRAASAATMTRSTASADGPVNNTPGTSPTLLPAVATTAALSDTQSETVDRQCKGCGTPVVSQTRYRLDPTGYQRQGVKLLAAKERCHPCYHRLRRPAMAETAEPEDPRRCGNCGRPMVSGQVFSANPDRWRTLGWRAHAAHGVCRNCRSAADGRRIRADRRAARQAPALGGLVDQLTMLCKKVQHLRRSHPDDVPLACMAAALGEVRRHLDAACVRVANESAGTADTRPVAS